MNELDLEHGTAHVNGIDLHYVTAGTGPLVLMLHGFPEFWYSWRHQIGPLAATHRVVAVDQRGYNTSSKPATVRDYALPHLLDDVAGLLDHFGAERATIVGHDWGGVVAWLWAIRHPERTERLAVINLPHPALLRRAWLRNPRQILRSWYVGFFQIPHVPEWVLSRNNYAALCEAFKRTARRPDTFTPADIAMYVQAWSQPGALTAMINWYRALVRYGYGWIQNLSTLRVHVPTLLIWGTHDIALGQELTYGTERYVDDLRVRYLNGVSHWAQQEAPEQVNAALVPFVDEGLGVRD